MMSKTKILFFLFFGKSSISHVNMKKFLNFLSINLTNLNFINKDKITLSKKNVSFLATISGGQDSILTFFLLLHIYKKDYVWVLYCQHFWQLKNFFSAKF